MKIYVFSSRGEDYEDSWVVEKVFAKREDAEAHLARKTVIREEYRNYNNLRRKYVDENRFIFDDEPQLPRLPRWNKDGQEAAQAYYERRRQALLDWNTKFNEAMMNAWNAGNHSCSLDEASGAFDQDFEIAEMEVE